MARPVFDVSKAARVGVACAGLMMLAGSAMAAEYHYAGEMKDLTVLQCTGPGRWARGPMDAKELYAVDAANRDILLYNPQSASFASICSSPDCAVSIDSGSYSVSRDDGDNTYSLSISRGTGGWAEDQAARSDKTAFIKKEGACKSIKNPLPKTPKNKF